MNIPAFESFWHWASWFTIITVIAAGLTNIRLICITKKTNVHGDN